MDNVTPITEAPKASKQEKLDAYCQGLCDGLSKRDAYVAAGYAPTGAMRNAQAYHKLNATYINGFIGDHIGSHAPTALKVILRIMNDESEKGGIRLKAAQDILDRAGHGAKQKLEISTPDIKDMSTEDLQNELKRALQDSPELANIFAFPTVASGQASKD